MNWEQARSLAEDHQGRCGVAPTAGRHRRKRRPRRARRRIGWALVDVGLRLAVDRPMSSDAAARLHV
jgi:hypothetical protein